MQFSYGFRHQSQPCTCLLTGIEQIIINCLAQLLQFSPKEFGAPVQIARESYARRIQLIGKHFHHSKTQQVCRIGLDHTN